MKKNTADLVGYIDHQRRGGKRPHCRSPSTDTSISAPKHTQTTNRVVVQCILLIAVIYDVSKQFSGKKGDRATAEYMSDSYLKSLNEEDIFSLFYKLESRRLSKMRCYKTALAFLIHR